MMKQLLNEWKKFVNEEMDVEDDLAEDKEYPRLPDFDPSKITFQVGPLQELLSYFPKIKKLRVPSWYLQTDLYPNKRDNKTMAAVAFHDKLPVSIVTISDDLDQDEPQLYGLLNFFTDSFFRGLRLPEKLFSMLMKHSGAWKYIVASRNGRKYMSDYKTFSNDCAYMDCQVYVNKNWSGSEGTGRLKKLSI
jgi:hypothetical protein